MYQNGTESISEASRRTVEEIAGQIPGLDARVRVLDLGSGYGGAARYLASVYGCHVTCLNLSETQNRHNIALNRAQGLALMIHVVDGNFEEILLPDGRVDLVWSQDALLHSGDRTRVFAEVSRVLDKGGHFVFTDIMQAESCSPGAMEPILDRLHLASLGSLSLYRQCAVEAGLEEVQWRDLSPHLRVHYARVLQEVRARGDTLRQVCGQAYLDRVRMGLQHWIDAGSNGDLIWGICHFRKT
jgi:sarcosine/dimethylglycine N-methyltransferase